MCTWLILLLILIDNIVIKIIQFNIFQKILYRSRSLGSAAIHLCYIAMGSIDICSFVELKCWDVAAGILIVQEAGGIVLDSNGKNKFKIPTFM